VKILPMSEPIPPMDPTLRLERIYFDVHGEEPEDDICAVGGWVFPEDEEDE
tara:strand:- start:8374 stop:8526 length:153 start_codon:yes stop_codon:yes gene_type:complete